MLVARVHSAASTHGVIFRFLGTVAATRTGCVEPNHSSQRSHFDRGYVFCVCKYRASLNPRWSPKAITTAPSPLAWRRRSTWLRFARSVSCARLYADWRARFNCGLVICSFTAGLWTTVSIDAIGLDLCIYRQGRVVFAYTVDTCDVVLPNSAR